MEDDQSSNENLAIIEQDYDYENELTTKPMKKMTKLDKSKSIESLTDIHCSDEFITKRYFMGSPTRFVVPLPCKFNTHMVISANKPPHKPWVNNLLSSQ